jgi:hypothetical protein
MDYKTIENRSVFIVYRKTGLARFSVKIEVVLWQTVFCRFQKLIDFLFFNPCS